MSISTVTSEALQLKIRQLLPSQAGFGTDLSASDTIIPIVDLTQAAEGSDVPENLQTALSFGSQTEYAVTNGSATIVSNTGFYRIFGVSSIRGTANSNVTFSLTDGVSTKEIWKAFGSGTTNTMVDFIVFLAAGESLTTAASTVTSYSYGSTRQLADINGTLVQPTGFNPQ